VGKSRQAVRIRQGTTPEKVDSRENYPEDEHRAIARETQARRLVIDFEDVVAAFAGAVSQIGSEFYRWTCRPQGADCYKQRCGAADRSGAGTKVAMLSLP
jgi:hypothetical protein